MYKYYLVEVKYPRNPQKHNKPKKLSQFQIKLIAVIGIALIIISSVIFYAANKILNPALIKVLVEPSLEYDDIFGCGEDLLRVIKIYKESEESKEVFKFGIINKYGKIILPVIYDSIGYYSDNFNVGDYISEGLLSIGKDGKYGFIDKTGKIVVPLIYDGISYFKEGLAAARKDGKCGYIDQNGNVIIDFIYEQANDFSEGLAIVDVDNKGKRGVINKNGEIVIPFDYYLIAVGETKFTDGLVILGKDETGKWENCKWGAIDNTGKIIVPFEYINLSYNENDKYFTAVKENETNIINKNGEIITIVENDKYLQWRYFYNDELFVMQQNNGKYGCINKAGEVAIPFVYDYINGFEDGLSIVTVGQNSERRWGVINEAGKIIVPLEYDRVYIFTDELIMARKSLKFGYLNRTGEIVIPFIYDRVGWFEYGLTGASINGKFGIIDKTGNIVIDFIYESVNIIDEHIIQAYKSGKCGLINIKGDVILDFAYDEIWEAGGKILCVKKDGKWGIIEKK